MKKIITLTVCFCVSYVKAQINPSSLFIIVDNIDNTFKEEKRIINGNIKYTEIIKHFKDYQEIEHIYSNGKITKFYEVHYINEAHNWRVAFRFSKNSITPINSNYILLLPKEMFNSYQEKGNTISKKEKEKEWNPITIAQISRQIRTNYSEYVYRHLSEGKFFDRIKYNIFIVFTSDLEKDYIPCYEVDVLVSTIVEE